MKKFNKLILLGFFFFFTDDRSAVITSAQRIQQGFFWIFKVQQYSLCEYLALNSELTFMAFRLCVALSNFSRGKTDAIRSNQVNEVQHKLHQEGPSAEHTPPPLVSPASWGWEVTI